MNSKNELIFIAFFRKIVTYITTVFNNEKMLNNDTRTALAEYKEMRNNPIKYKRYSSFDELLDEIL